MEFFFYLYESGFIIEVGFPKSKLGDYPSTER